MCETTNSETKLLVIAFSLPTKTKKRVCNTAAWLVCNLFIVLQWRSHRPPTRLWQM